MRRAVELGSVLRQFDATVLNELLDRTEDDPAVISALCTFSFTERHVRPETSDTYYRFHEFIRSEMDAQLALTKPQRHRELHARAAVHYASWLTRCEETDRDEAAYCRAYRYERPDWQAMVHEWLHHLYRLGDRQAALEVARVYLAAFWWWGCFLRFPFCERLLREWDLADERPDVREVVALLRQFQSAYPPEAEPDLVSADWLAAQDAVQELIDVEAATGPGRDVEAAWRRAQLRAYLYLFLAHTERGQDAHDPGIDEAYARAREEFLAFAHDDDLWNLPWITYELGDLALQRGHLEQAGRQGASVVADASGKPTDQDNEVLAKAHRLLGDVAWQQGDLDGAVRAYELAVLHAYAFQVLPKPADFYTIAFYDLIAEHVANRLRELPARLPTEAAGRILESTHQFWQEYWRRVGEPVLPGSPAELLAQGQLAEVLPYLFPRQPRRDTAGAGSDEGVTARPVVKATFARLRRG